MSTGATTNFQIPLFGDADLVTPIQSPLNAQANALDTALTKSAYLTYPTRDAMNLVPGTAVGQHATVNADTAVKNGDYSWNGTTWVQTTVPGASRVIPATAVGGTISGGTVSFTSATQVSLNNCFSAAYDNYHIELVGTCALATQLTTLLLRSGGSDSSAANYDYTLIYSLGTPAATNLNARGSFQLGAANPMTNFKASVDISSPFLAQLTTITAASAGYASAASPLLGQLSGGHRLATSFDGFTVTFTVAASGSIRVYGWNN